MVIFLPLLILAGICVWAAFSKKFTLLIIALTLIVALIGFSIWLGRAVIVN